MTRQSEWIRVTKSDVCPICESDTWCGVSEDKAVCRCMRVESDKPAFGKDGRGWIHRLSDTPLPPQPRSSPPKRKRLSDHELHAKLAPFARHHYIGNETVVKELAIELGVAYWALDVLHVGYVDEGSASCFTFPEQNHRGQIVGISRRYTGGRKYSIGGASRGLSYCDDWQDYTGPIYIVEGGSDVAAGLTLGLCAIGRPSNTGGVDYLVKMLGRHRDRRIVVLGERDRKPHDELKPKARSRHDPKCRYCMHCYPGMAGAVHVSGALRKRLSRKVEWRMPPDKAKDLRSWLNATGYDVDDDVAMRQLGARVFK